MRRYPPTGSRAWRQSRRNSFSPPVADLLPASPSKVLDVGAGTGRDAAWLASQGHSVLAVEPVAQLRHAGMALHGSSGIQWLDDRLPDLKHLRDKGGFDLILLVGVWQHLDEGQRSVAIRRLASLTAASGTLIVSLRHGPGAPGRPVHRVRPEDTISSALAAGFRLVRERRMESIQAANRAAGVHSTWLVFALN